MHPFKCRVNVPAYLWYSGFDAWKRILTRSSGATTVFAWRTSGQWDRLGTPRRDVYTRHNQQHRQRCWSELLGPRIETWMHQSSFELSHIRSGPSTTLTVSASQFRVSNFACEFETPPGGAPLNRESDSSTARPLDSRFPGGASRPDSHLSRPSIHVFGRPIHTRVHGLLAPLGGPKWPLDFGRHASTSVRPASTSQAPVVTGVTSPHSHTALPLRASLASECSTRTLDL